MQVGLHELLLIVGVLVNIVQQLLVPVVNDLDVVLKHLLDLFLSNYNGQQVDLVVFNLLHQRDLDLLNVDLIETAFDVLRELLDDIVISMLAEVQTLMHFLNVDLLHQIIVLYLPEGLLLDHLIRALQNQKVRVR